MVGPRPEDERRTSYRRFQAGLVMVVGASASLIAVKGDARPVVVAVAGVAGLVLGTVLVLYVFPNRQTRMGRSPREHAGDRDDDRE